MEALAEAGVFSPAGETLDWLTPAAEGGAGVAPMGVLVLDSPPTNSTSRLLLAVDAAAGAPQLELEAAAADAAPEGLDEVEEAAAAETVTVVVIVWA